MSLLYLVSPRQCLHKQISDLRRKIIKLYLDRKLMIRLINRLINKDAMQSVIYDVIEYFILDDIIIYNAEGNNPQNEIIDYIENNRSSIIEYLSNNQSLKIQINMEEKDEQYIVVQYIIPQSKKLIIYVEKIHNKLSKNDIEMITEAVTPILQLAYNTIPEI